MALEVESQIFLSLASLPIHDAAMDLMLEVGELGRRECSFCAIVSSEHNCQWWARGMGNSVVLEHKL